MKYLLAGAALLMSAPIAAQEPSAYDAAVTARRGDDPASAVHLLDRWIEQHPRDSDALVQRGYAHLALGHLRRAEQDFQAALAIAPDYADARAGLAQVAEQRRLPRGGYLIAGGAWSALGAGNPDWWEASVSAGMPVSRTLSAGGRASWYRRFGREDLELEGQMTSHPSDNVWLRASAGGTPNADFRPEVALSAGADLRISKGPSATLLSLDTAWQRFPLQDVVTVSPGITQFFGRGRWSGTLHGIGVLTQGRSLEAGVLGRLDYVPDERHRYFVGAANAPDTDLGIVTRVTSAYAGAELPLAGRLSLLPSFARTWRKGGPDRTELRLELKATF